MARTMLSVMSLVCPAARRGHATHSDPAGMMARASVPISAASSPAPRKKAKTMSAVAADVVTVTPGGRSSSSQPRGAAQRSTRWPAFMPILPTNDGAGGAGGGVLGPRLPGAGDEEMAAP